MQCSIEASSRSKRDCQQQVKGGLLNDQRQTGFDTESGSGVARVRGDRIGLRADGRSAGAGAAAPHAELPAIPGTSVQSGPSGSTTTEIREYDSFDQDKQAKDDSNNQPSDDWTEVKGSDDGNQ
jgi:hypothetical protein